MTGSLRAKFRLYQVAQREGTQEFEFHAVYGKDGSDNASWSKATPVGKLTMTVTNEAAWGMFEPGTDVYLDITEAPKPDA